jgi:hypothetical protein
MGTSVVQVTTRGFFLVFRNLLNQCFPEYGMRTAGGTRKDFKGYAAEKKLLKIVPEFCLLSDEL